MTRIEVLGFLAIWAAGPKMFPWLPFNDGDDADNYGDDDGNDAEDDGDGVGICTNLGAGPRCPPGFLSNSDSVNVLYSPPATTSICCRGGNDKISICLHYLSGNHWGK